MLEDHDLEALGVAEAIRELVDQDAVLDVGASRPLQIDVRCVERGDAKITCHIHADIDRSDLFPTSQNPSDEQTVAVF